MALQKQISESYPDAKLTATGPDSEGLHILDVTFGGARVIIGWWERSPFYLTTATPEVAPDIALGGNSGYRCDTEESVLRVLDRIFSSITTVREKGLLKGVANLLLLKHKE